MIFLKVNNNNGSIMVLVIVIIAIVSIFIPVISFQNITQIKSTMKNENTLDYKYAAETGIDKTIAEVCRQVEEILNNYEENVVYKIEIPKEFYVVNNDISCIVDGIKKKISIDIDEENSNLLKINNLVIEIISTANKRTNEDEYYKIKSTVNIKSDFIDNKYITNYEVLSYEKI